MGKKPWWRPECQKSKHPNISRENAASQNVATSVKHAKLSLNLHKDLVESILLSLFYRHEEKGVWSFVACLTSQLHSALSPGPYFSFHHTHKCFLTWKWRLNLGESRQIIQLGRIIWLPSLLLDGVIVSAYCLISQRFPRSTSLQAIMYWYKVSYKDMLCNTGNIANTLW